MKPKLIDVIQNQPSFFKNVDVRALIGKYNSKEENEVWQLIFLRMYFTNSSKDELKQRFKEIKTIFNRNQQCDCILVTECVPYQKITNFLKQLEHGKIVIDGKLIEPKLNSSIGDLQLERYENYLIENSPYDHWVTGDKPFIQNGEDRE